MAKKEKINKKREEIQDIKSLLDAVWNPSFNRNFGEFLTKVIRRAEVEKNAFEKNIEEKRKILEETPLTRKQFEEKIKELENESNPFLSDMFNHQSELFMKAVLGYYISKNVEDNEKANEIFEFIWRRLDFMSLVFFFRNYSYSQADEYEDNYDEEGHYSPCSSCHIYFDDSDNFYAYQGNLVDKVIDMMK